MLRGIIDASSKFSGAGEGGGGLGCAVSAGVYHRLTEACLKLQPSLARRGGVVDFVGFGKGSEKFLCLLQTVGEKGREIVTLPNSS
jgi:hypothetical protein